MPHDVVVTMGAGDITKVGRELKLSRRLKLALLSGGCSSEHEISLLSADNVKHSLDDSLYDIERLFIPKSGSWLNSEVLNSLQKADVIFPVLHGPNGEDGTVQGFIELLQKPYIGCNHYASTACMDKVITKRILQSAKLPTADFITFSSKQWTLNSQLYLDKIQQKFNFPVYVKPSCMGSSIGVSRVTDAHSLPEAIENAFSSGSHLLVEQEIEGRELECALLGDESLIVAGPGEIIRGTAVYDYNAKYAENGMKTSLSPELSDKKKKEIQTLAKQAYSLLGCSALARVDFFLDKNEKFWINEINTIPGFTDISLYPLLFKELGISTTELLNRLVILAMKRHRNKVCSL